LDSSSTSCSSFSFRGSSSFEGLGIGNLASLERVEFLVGMAFLASYPEGITAFVKGKSLLRG